MRINRTTATVGLATLGLVTLTGGGIAWASADGSRPSTASTGTFHCPGGYGMAYGRYAPMAAVADYLGMTRTELTDQLRSGKTLAEIAQAHGKTVAGLKTAMVSAMKRNLAADTDLTDAQRTAILAMMNSHVDAMISGRHTAGIDEDDLDGMMGGAGGGMMGGRGGGPRGFGNGMMGS
jgi:hypothetical protein